MLISNVVITDFEIIIETSSRTINGENRNNNQRRIEKHGERNEQQSVVFIGRT